MSSAQTPQTASPFGWIDDGNGSSSRVPTVGFDFESVFERMDGEDSEDKQQPKRQPLTELLSPGELKHALAVARKLFLRSSPRSRASHATWRNPVSRQKMLSVIMRSARSPEVQRKKSESMHSYWQSAKGQERHARIMQMWRERSPEFRTACTAAINNPKCHGRRLDTIRANWADPVRRQHLLARIWPPAARLRESLIRRRYFQDHPEARQKEAERQRAVWRSKEFRIRFSRTIAARKLATARKCEPPSKGLSKQAIS